MNWHEPIALALVVGVAYGGYACTTIDKGNRVSGWPELKVYEHHVPHKVMRDRCNRYAARFDVPEACAIFHFANSECHIWLSAEFPVESHRQHELEHCQGFEHVGEHGMRDALAAYRRGL